MDSVRYISNDHMDNSQDIQFCISSHVNICGHFNMSEGGDNLVVGENKLKFFLTSQGFEAFFKGTLVYILTNILHYTPYVTHIYAKPYCLLSLQTCSIYSIIDTLSIT